MRFTKEMQYAILFAIYLCRAGRTTVDSAAAGLNVSYPFLQQIALKLKKGGLVRAIKGPNGGYELAYEPSIADVMNSIEPFALLTQSETSTYVVGEIEHRSFAAFANNLRSAMMPQLNRKIRSIEKETTVNELAMLNKLTSASILN